MTHAHLHIHSLSVLAGAAGACTARVGGIGTFDGRPTQRGGASTPPWAMPSNGRRRITSYKQ